MTVVQGTTDGGGDSPLWVYLSTDGRRWSYDHRLN
jgi:hypothetical protein